MSRHYHINSGGTNLTSNQIAGVTTTPINAVPGITTPFYMVLDATNINGKYEEVEVTGKTATNVNHLATTYAHTTAEEVRFPFVKTEADALSAAVNGGPLYDTNGNESIKTGTTASAVNEITVTNAATGGTPSLAASGDDTNIALKVEGKGTGKVYPALAYGSAVGSDTTNGSTTGVDITGATVTFTPSVASVILISAVGSLESTIAGDLAVVDILIDGVVVGGSIVSNCALANKQSCVSSFYVGTLTAAAHTVKLQLRVAVGTGTVKANGTNTRFNYFLISQ